MIKIMYDDWLEKIKKKKEKRTVKCKKRERERESLIKFKLMI